jgi:hypothetical protein
MFNFLSKKIYQNLIRLNFKFNHALSFVLYSEFDYQNKIILFKKKHIILNNYFVDFLISNYGQNLKFILFEFEQIKV